MNKNLIYKYDKMFEITRYVWDQKQFNVTLSGEKIELSLYSRQKCKIISSLSCRCFTIYKFLIHNFVQLYCKCKLNRLQKKLDRHAEYMIFI